MISVAGMCRCCIPSVLSDFLPFYGLEPSTHLCSWDSLDKNTGVGCHVLLQQTFLTQGVNLGLLGLLPWQATGATWEAQGFSSLQLTAV